MSIHGPLIVDRGMLYNTFTMPGHQTLTLTMSGRDVRLVSARTLGHTAVT